MKFFIHIFFVSFIFANEVDFEQAKDLLFKNNVDLQIKNQDIQEAITKSNKADSLFLPSVDLEFAYTKLNDEIAIKKTMTLPLPPPMPPKNIPINIPVQEESFKKANINFKWAIFTGGQIVANKKIANANVGLVSSDVNSHRNKAIIDLVKAYYGLVLSQEFIKVQEENQRVLDVHLKNTQKRFDEGQIARTELLHAKVAFSNALTKKEEAKSNYAVASAILQNLIHKKITPTKGLRSVIFPIDLRLDPNHPAITRANNLSCIADASKLFASGKFLPTVYLFGKKELLEDDLTAFEPKWAVGVGVKLNLVSTQADYQNLQLAKIAQIKAKLAKEKTKTMLKTAQKIKKEEFIKFKNQEKNLQTTLKFAQESLRSRQKAYKAGLSTSFDVVDAQLSVSKVKLAILKARYDEIVALASLLRAYGMLESFQRYTK